MRLNPPFQLMKQRPDRQLTLQRLEATCSAWPSTDRIQHQAENERRVEFDHGARLGTTVSTLWPHAPPGCVLRLPQPRRPPAWQLMEKVCMLPRRYFRFQLLSHDRLCESLRPIIVIHVTQLVHHDHASNTWALQFRRKRARAKGL